MGLGGFPMLAIKFIAFSSTGKWKFSLIFTSSCLSNMPIAGTVTSNEKVAPNKAANILDWGTGKVWASLSIDSPQ